MKTRTTLKPGRRGTKYYVNKYGDRLVCVRYKYDKEKLKKYITVELIAEESDWMPLDLIQVPIQIAYEEENLRAAARSAGGHWDHSAKCWYIPYTKLKASGLKDRVITSMPSAIAKPKSKVSIYKPGRN